MLINKESLWKGECFVFDNRISLKTWTSYWHIFNMQWL